MKAIEEYAIKLVVAGAIDHAEDDLNENGDIADPDHGEACVLALNIAAAIRANPAVVLDLAARHRAAETRVVPLAAGDDL